MYNTYDWYVKLSITLAHNLYLLFSLFELNNLIKPLDESHSVALSNTMLCPNRIVDSFWESSTENLVIILRPY